MEVDANMGDLYDSKMAIPDSVFDTDTDESLIPGFKEGRLPPCIKAICTKYARVLKKSLTADKGTAFEPAMLPIIQGAKPIRRAKTCRKTPLHWKRTLDEMIDALMKAEMIEKVHEHMGDFLFKVFFVPKPRDPTGPPRMVVHYSPLKHCFDRNPFKQSDPFTILSALKSSCRYHFVADMSTGYWQICLVDGPNGSHTT